MRKDFAKKHAKTYTVLGRVRKLPRVWAKNWKVKAGELRRSVNTACQGSCGDALKLAILELDKLSKDFLANVGLRVVCPVFDACLLELNVEATVIESQIEAAIKEAFEVKLSYEGRTTRMACDLGWSTVSWLEAMKK